MIPLVQALARNPKFETIDIYDNNVGPKGAPFLVQVNLLLYSQLIPEGS